MEKMRQQQGPQGREYLEFTRGSKVQPLSRVKIELLEMYAMQMLGTMVLDNKQINEISTSGSSSEELSEMSDFEESLKPRDMHSEDLFQSYTAAAPEST